MVTRMAYKMEAAERVYRVVVGLVVIVIGLFIFFPLGMWWGIVVMMLGTIPLASGLLGACPTYPLMGMKY